MNLDDAKVAIIGLGYVGLPLAVEFGKLSSTIGFDINEVRVKELCDFRDRTLECSREQLLEAKLLRFTSTLEDIIDCNTYIITVPTPIDEHKQPDLSPLISASESIAKVISRGDVVIYESTVYPGATEEICIPVIERLSGLVFNKDFFAGYSPERINPGDKERRVSNILKVTSGSNPEVAEFVDELYGSIIEAGTFKASSIKVAEASKVIENTQRDVNIALINELHHIFNRMGIDTNEVIDAAATKWNFMKLTPGLVGGHCIGVDPYYLLHKAQKSGYIPDLMRQAREINDSMPEYLAQDFLSKLITKKINPISCNVGLFGFSFKENCPDIRNTKVYDLYLSLKSLGFKVTVYDDWVCKEECLSEYNLQVVNKLDDKCDVAFLAVGHSSIVSHLKSASFDMIYDFKGALS